jgi:hypothetical protein
LVSEQVLRVFGEGGFAYMQGCIAQQVLPTKLKKKVGDTFVEGKVYKRLHQEIVSKINRCFGEEGGRMGCAAKCNVDCACGCRNTVQGKLGVVAVVLVSRWSCCCQSAVRAASNRIFAQLD